MDGRAEALLYVAARRQHLVERVIPALNEGKIVLCDRFVGSSLSYQGYAKGLRIEKVMSINRLDLEKIEFHQKVKTGYDIVYENNSNRIVKINANQSKENVIKNIKNILLPKLQEVKK